MEESKFRRGILAFALSGVCAMASSNIVKLLQQILGFDYTMTGSLLSLMNIGNLCASFLAGVLPIRIGKRNTVLIMGIGYALGYLIMGFAGGVVMLVPAFLFLGIGKGCAINTCTVLVGENSKNRTKGMNIMHSSYAAGALLSPIFISILLGVGDKVPMFFLSAVGLVMYIVLLSSKLPGKKPVEEKANKRSDWSFMREKKFWLLAFLLFCQNGVELSVTGWMVTYYKDSGILAGSLANYTITILWCATLIGRLFIAFVCPVKNRFRTLFFMSLGCLILYPTMIYATSPILAIILLFLFSLSIAGINPTAVAGAGDMLSDSSMGVLLSFGGIGAIVMPYVMGVVATLTGDLKMGMMTNVVAIAGMMLFSLLALRLKGGKDDD